MAEDLDLDRVITDPAYRRHVIARLNGAPAEQLVDLDMISERPLPQSIKQQPLD